MGRLEEQAANLIRQEIVRLQGILDVIEGSEAPAATKRSGTFLAAGGRRQVSAEARARIAEAQKNRWAQKRAAETAQQETPTPEVPQEVVAAPEPAPEPAEAPIKRAGTRRNLRRSGSRGGD